MIPTEGQQPVKVYKPVAWRGTVPPTFMQNRRTHKVTIIRYSCLTGKALWVYRGPSKRAAAAAYCRACQKEVERVNRWSDTMQRRKSNIMRMLNNLTASVPIDGELSPEREAAARQLLSMAQAKVTCYMEFYEHIMEERRRRAETREIHRQMRDREDVTTTDYTD